MKNPPRAKINLSSEAKLRGKRVSQTTIEEILTKRDLILSFIQHLETQISFLKESARAAHDAATNEESQPENQYDTRALEASYLAGAQSKRVLEVTELLNLFKTMPFKEFSSADAVQATALIDVRVDEKTSKMLMMPKGGGVDLKQGDDVIQIVTPASALGETIIGMKVGDIAEYEVGKNIRECEILSIR
jgi:hypothetical protein